MISRSSTFIGLMLMGLLGISAIGGTQEDTWTKKADMPTTRGEHSTSVVDGKIYVIGGSIRSEEFSTVEEYDPTTDIWTRKTDMPTARTLASTTVVNGKIYVIGGAKRNPLEVLSTVEVYDPTTDTWTKEADMPTPRATLSASAVNGKIYAIGGEDLAGRLRVVEEYDPTTNTWTQKVDMPTARFALSTSVVNGKIYAIGGDRRCSGRFADLTSTVEAYDPATNAWTKKADMPTARNNFTAIALNGKIYAIGGWNGQNGGTGVISTVEAYDTGVSIQVTVISPQQGSVIGGDPIALAGSRFPLDAVVTIGGQPLINLQVTDGLISGLTPPGTAGEQQILITAPSIDFTVFVGTFRYTQPSRPVAVSMTPTSSLQSGGEQAVIEGAGFQEGLTVTIGLAKATDVVVTPTQITFTIPENNRPGTLVVVVENPGGGSHSRLMYTYISLPEIERLEPNKGPVEGGTQVTLFGKGFLPDAKVTIGDVPAEQVEFLAFTRLRFLTPPNTEGAKAVRVINSDGQETVRHGAFT